jgi:hypothetical protein
MNLDAFDRELNGFEIAVCENQGALFRDCQADFNVDALDFIEKFMTGSIAADMDAEISAYHNNGTKQIGEAVLRVSDVRPFSGKPINTDILYWIGYVYRYWSWWLGTTSATIYETADIIRMIAAYGLHVLSPERAITKLLQDTDVTT